MIIRTLSLLFATFSLPIFSQTSTSISLLDQEHVYFVGGDNRRIVEFEADLPVNLNGRSITLELDLDCPQGSCDYWDRKGSLEWLDEKEIA